MEDEFGEKFQKSSLEFLRGCAGVLALFGVHKSGLGHIIILAPWHTFRQMLALGNKQVMQPLATLPKKFDICRKAEVAFVTGRIRQTQILVIKIVFPFSVQYMLKAVYVKKWGKTITDGTYNLPILDRVGGVYQYTTEHLHVDASVEHLYQAIV